MSIKHMVKSASIGESKIVNGHIEYVILLAEMNNHIGIKYVYNNIHYTVIYSG